MLAALSAAGRPGVAPIHRRSQLPRGPPRLAARMGTPQLGDRRRGNGNGTDSMETETAALLASLESVRSYDSIIDRWRDSYEMGAASPRPNGDVFSMEVTKENFPRMLSALRDCLNDAQFVAIDCEMTGLFGPDNINSWWDTAEDRYAAQRASVEKFLAHQIGVSVFQWEEGPTVESPGCYVAHTFNFYVMPPEPRDGSPPRFFLCDPGSLHFLASCSFDFNKWVYHGVPFAPLSSRSALLQRLAERAEEECPALNEDATKWRDEHVAKVEAWLATEGDVAPLDIAPMNAFLRKVLYYELATIQERQKDKGPEAHSLWWDKVEQERGSWVGLRLERVTASEVQSRKQTSRAASVQAVHDLMGFSAVMEVLRDSRVPLIGHNMGLDLLFLTSQFIAPLPPTWPAFCALMREWLPGGVYDTKLIARGLPFEVFQGDTALGTVYTALVERSGPASAAVDAYLRDLVHGAKESNAGDKTGDKAGDTTTDHSDLPQPWTLPRVRHAEGFGRYAGVEGAGLAHEAGYDAWMTGAVFGALLRVAQAKGMAAEGPMGVERAMEGMGRAPGLEAVEGYRNRYNAAGVDLAYWSIDGDSPLGSARTNVLVVYKGASMDSDMGVTASSVLNAARSANVGRVKTETRWGRSAVYVELLDKDYAQDPQRVQGALTKVAEALGKEGRTKDLSVALYAKWLAEQQAAAAAAQEQEMRRERERPAKKVRSK